MDHVPNVIKDLNRIANNLDSLSRHAKDINSKIYDLTICNDLSWIAANLKNVTVSLNDLMNYRVLPFANELTNLSNSITRLSDDFSTIISESIDPDFGDLYKQHVAQHIVQHIDDSYISLVNNIINNGYDTDNTRMLPMQIIRANNIAQSFPVVQHKKLFVKGVWEELLFFLHGYRDVRILQSKGVHIWDANADPAYKKLHNKHLDDYDLGPVYGCQWRNFNGKKCDQCDSSHASWSHCDRCDCNHTSWSHCDQHDSSHASWSQCDQLQDIVNAIKNHSQSRRLFMSAWNPQQLDEMVLPPCHVSYHFIPYIKNGVYTVDLMVYQRSADVMLGLPFNIASSAFMLLIVCTYCGVSAGDVCICIGNAHIYKEHFKSLDKVKEAASNIKYTNVTATVAGDISGSFDQFIDSVTYQLHNYNVTNTIKFDLVV